MNDSIDRHSGAETPEHMDRAVEQLARELEEMDRAQGVFGEAADRVLVDEEELEKVAGGIVPILPSEGYVQQTAKQTPSSSADPSGSSKTPQELYQQWLQQVGSKTGQS